MELELPEIVHIARNMAVMVRVSGPDPKGLKMRRHAFHQHESGKTTLSASGLLVPDSIIHPSVRGQLRGPEPLGSSFSAFVLTTASVVEPFLPLHFRNASRQQFPKLIPGAHMDILSECDCKKADTLAESDNARTPVWFSSELLALVDVPSSSVVLHSLVGADGIPSERGSWEIGWSLVPLNNADGRTVMGPLTTRVLSTKGKKDAEHFIQVGSDSGSYTENQKHYTSEESGSPNFTANLTTRLALLGVSRINSKDLPKINVSLSSKRGDLLLVMGSPFGVLSPVHFFNCISAGVVANCCPTSSSDGAILMADVRCLPGMEGGPVFTKHADLVGILTQPIRQRASGAEIQLVMTWNAIEQALKAHLQTVLQGANMNPSSPSRLQFEKALPSIVLVTMGDGAWASGIILNSQGLILTNAHLLEPWRFGKTLSGTDKTSYPASSVISKNSLQYSDGKNDHSRQSFELLNKVYRRIRVRLDHVEPPVWCNASPVYVSKGPLDVALLQLESLPNEVSPIERDLTCPSPGSTVYVIGHGLFGPRADLRPSVSSGFVAKVVLTPKPADHDDSNLSSTRGQLPAMLETTAAVHPGVSGGAVVGSDGCMVGLVTSNARHGGGTLIPHLNFSIPCAALKPIFKFSETRDEKYLIALDKPNESLSTVWALKPPPPSGKQSGADSSLPQFLPEQKGGRGSRFAKFISERKGEISSFDKKAGSNAPVLPSKL